MVSRSDVSYPEMDVSDAIRIAEKVVRQLKSLTFTKEALAQAIGLSTSNSGAFTHKLADLRKYGIIEGKLDDLRASELAKVIAIPKNVEERKNAVKTMVLGVPIYKELLDHFGERVPTEDELMSFLLTKTDRLSASSMTNKVKKLYTEVLNQIGGQEAYSLRESETSKMQDEEPMESSSGKFILKWEDIDIKLKSDDLESINAILQLLTSKISTRNIKLPRDNQSK